LPGANFYWLYEPPFCDRHLAARRPSVGSLCRFLHSVYGLFPMPLLCSSRRPRAYRRKVKVHMWVGFFFWCHNNLCDKIGLNMRHIWQRVRRPTNSQWTMWSKRAAGCPGSCRVISLTICGGS
jgi:hypothetical protein